MSDFKANMHQIRFRLGLRPSPSWGSLQRSPDPIAGLEGPTSKGERRGRKGRDGREGEGLEVRAGKGGKGREGRERKGGKSRKWREGEGAP